MKESHEDKRNTISIQRYKIYWNIYAPNNGILKYMEQKLTDSKKKQTEINQRIEDS